MDDYMPEVLSVIKSVPATHLGSGIPATASTNLPPNPNTSSATLTINPFGLAWGATLLILNAASLSCPGCFTAIAIRAAAVDLEDPAQQCAKSRSPASGCHS